MPNRYRIAVDTMGGDLGPRPCVMASQKILRQIPEIDITLVGDESLIEPHLSPELPSVDVVHASDVVGMSDRPSSALRSKRQSSMSKAINLLSVGEVQACVSGGNTGALMAFGMNAFGCLGDIDRPAICKSIPSLLGKCWVLDLGASLESSAPQLLRFAQMARVVALQNGVERPRIGLLNVGTEANKGKDVQQQAAKLFASAFGVDEYIGFVEGGDVFRGAVDIAVCDGFSGNVMLKASEGAVEFVQSSINRFFTKSIVGRFVRCVARPYLNAWKSEYDIAKHNGAMLLGLSEVVVKSHGSASEEGFMSAIAVAYEQLSMQTVNEIRRGLAFENEKGGSSE